MIDPVILGLMKQMNKKLIAEEENSIPTTSSPTPITTSTTGTTTTTKKTFLKVQFFEEINLMILRDQMNTFFEQEGLAQKNRIVKIEYSKDEYGRHLVMVVYRGW